MEELKDYQERFINSKEKLVIGNFARGMGKTFCLAQKIIKEKPEKVTIFAMTTRRIDFIIEKIRYYQKDTYIEHMDCKKIKIIWENNEKTYITLVNNCDMFLEEVDILGSLIIFEDMKGIKGTKEYIDFYLDRKDKFNQIICTTTENNYDKHLEKNYPNADIIEVDALQGIRKGLFDSEVLMKDFKKYDNHSFYNEFAILSNPDVNKSTQNKYISANKIDIQGDLNINNNDFLDRTLNSLIKEYESIPVQNNTVMTRQNLLNMIMSIENIKKE